MEAAEYIVQPCELIVASTIPKYTEIDIFVKQNRH
jgi:hypothetical protein